MRITDIFRRKSVLAGSCAVVMAIIGVFAFGGGKKNSNYSFATISRGAVENTISSTGTFNAVTEVAVGTQVSGTIEKVYVDFNQRVKKGQIIAVLDSAILRMAVSDARADLLKAEATLDDAQFNYKRNALLFEKAMISESDFRTAKTTFRSAEAGALAAQTALEKAEKNLSYAIIRAPIDGTVTERNVETGQTLQASFTTPTLFTIAQDLSKMEIKAAVDEGDIGQIKEGQAVRFTVQAYSKTFKGQVKQIRLKPTTSSNVVNYTVVVTASNDEGLLMPGMTATVEFIVAYKTDVLVVSNAALRFQPSDKKLAQSAERTEFSNPTSAHDSLQKALGVIGQAGQSSADLKTLWYLDKSGNLVPVSVQYGISDGSKTEIMGTRIFDGMRVITGSEETTAPSSSQISGSSSSSSPMM